MPDTLILGCGNVDRMDDGMAWHVLAGLAAALSGQVPESPEDVPLLPAGTADCKFVLQLAPELADLLARYRRVCFVDAHTGNLPAETRLAAVAPAFVTSPFTHHLTPAACLALAQAIYGRAPEAVVASARGEAFGFGRELSSAALRRVPVLVKRILTWLGEIGGDFRPAPLIAPVGAARLPRGRRRVPDSWQAIAGRRG